MTDREMNATYKASLEEAERELAGMDARRAALRATIAGLKSLIEDSEQPNLGPDIAPETNGRMPPKVPPRFFRGKSPTQAYRDLMQLWPGTYSAPEIRDALMAGGMEAKSKTQLLQSVHSVLRRERKRKKKEMEGRSKAKDQ